MPTTAESYISDTPYRWLPIVLSAAIGGWLAFFPLTGIVTLTVLLAIAFILQGLLELAMAFRLSQFPGWKWMLFSGGIAVLAGVLIFVELPSAATWAIGLLLGINLISSGLSYLMVSMAMRTVTKS